MPDFVFAIVIPHFSLVRVYLQSYEGIVVVVSHDQHVLDTITNHLYGIIEFLDHRKLENLWLLENARWRNESHRGYFRNGQQAT